MKNKPLIYHNHTTGEEFLVVKYRSGDQYYLIERLALNYNQETHTLKPVLKRGSYPNTSGKPFDKYLLVQTVNDIDWTKFKADMDTMVMRHHGLTAGPNTIQLGTSPITAAIDPQIPSLNEEQLILEMKQSATTPVLNVPVQAQYAVVFETAEKDVIEKHMQQLLNQIEPLYDEYRRLEKLLLERSEPKPEPQPVKRPRGRPRKNPVTT